MSIHQMTGTQPRTKTPGGWPGILVRDVNGGPTAYLTCTFPLVQVLSGRFA